MNKSKKYLMVLFSVLALILMGVLGYVVYYTKHYPLPITSRISLDAKLKFVRDTIDVEKIDTLIVGSSIGLNDIQGTYLEKKSSKVNAVINLSVYEATTLQSEQLASLRKAFPNLKRLIYSAQYSDFPSLRTYKDFDADTLAQYMAHNLNPIAFFKVVFDASKNIPFLIHRQKEWKTKHLQNNSFYYLGFDSTGSVPLHIYGKDIIQGRWRNPHPDVEHPKSFEALQRMAKNAQDEGLYFYFAHQPYRAPLVKKYKHVANAIDYVDKRSEHLLKEIPKAKLIALQPLGLDDSYFADRSHLNDKGSIVTAEAIAKFIDNNEK
jgi:hypothetical protein